MSKALAMSEATRLYDFVHIHLQSSVNERT